MEQEITDTLIELLICLAHRMGAKAEEKVDRTRLGNTMVDEARQAGIGYFAILGVFD